MLIIVHSGNMWIKRRLMLGEATRGAPASAARLVLPRQAHHRGAGALGPADPVHAGLVTAARAAPFAGRGAYLRLFWVVLAVFSGVSNF